MLEICTLTEPFKYALSTTASQQLISIDRFGAFILSD